MSKWVGPLTCTATIQDNGTRLKFNTTPSPKSEPLEVFISTQLDSHDIAWLNNRMVSVKQNPDGGVSIEEYNILRHGAVYHLETEFTGSPDLWGYLQGQIPK